MNPPMTLRRAATLLSCLPNGSCIARWNDSFDIELLQGGMTGGNRRMLSSGAEIDEGLFERARARVEELRQAKIL